jgi:arylsulfatase A-like enzyme
MRKVSKPIGRREFIGGVAASSALGAVSARARSRAPRPNVLFILADDLGYADLSCYGRPDYQTPNLDRLARQGVLFTNAYSASPVCTPTRCAFVTGRYPARTSVGLHEPMQWRKDLGEKVAEAGLAPDHPTVASLLKGGGYDTALVGKWHLGYLPQFGPNRHGFDEFFGILSGAADFFTHKDAHGDPDLFEGEVPVERAGYITDLLTDRAVEFVSRKRNRPFYLSLHYTAPHWPWEGPADGHVSATLGRGFGGFTAGGSLKTYAAMMKSLDDGIGEVLRALGAAGRDRDTLVIFTSDNGGERFSYNWPFAGQKGDLREGGIRVPAIVRWPGVAPANVRNEQVVVTMDWTATILAAAGAGPDRSYPLDGQDLSPSLRAAGAPRDRTLFWRHGDQDAVRSGRWKYLKVAGSEYLFDLDADAREQADFQARHPDVLRRLRLEHQAWQATVLPRPAPRRLPSD